MLGGISVRVVSVCWGDSRISLSLTSHPNKTHSNVWLDKVVRLGGVLVRVVPVREILASHCPSLLTPSFNKTQRNLRISSSIKKALLRIRDL